MTWKPQECADVEDKGGLTVRRFRVAGQRHPRWFEFFSGDKGCISALEQLDRLSSDRYDDLGRRCIAYVKRYYDTDNAEKEYVNLVEYVSKGIESL